MRTHGTLREVLTFWGAIFLLAAMLWLAIGLGAATVSQILWGHF